MKLTELRKATPEDMRVGRLYYQNLSLQKKGEVKASRFRYRERLVRGNNIEGARLWSTESEEDYRDNYVRRIHHQCSDRCMDHERIWVNKLLR